MIGPRRAGTPRALVLLAASLLVLAALVLGSLTVGVHPTPLATAMAALWRPDPLDIAHIIVVTERLPRTVVALVVGASLAVAGALMQALTRNPLASPGLMGVNSGAVFCIVLLVVALPAAPLSGYLWAAFAGAGVAGAASYFLGTLASRHDARLGIVLAGAAVTALFASFTQAVLVIEQESLETVLFWLGGSVAGHRLADLPVVLLCVAAALTAALLLARRVDLMAASDDVARGLGQHVGRNRALVALVIVALAASAVSIAGSIGFIGLIVPHMARRLMPRAHRWLIPGCALLGAALLLGADILARLLIAPREVPVGVMTALIGVPLFIRLLRRPDRHD